MKKTAFILAICLLGVSAFAQTGSKDNMGRMPGKMDKMHHGMKDCVMMEGGKMMVMKGGQNMAMDDNMTLSNGTMIMTDGTVKMKNGKTKMLKDGQMVFMDGTMGMKNGDMKMSKGKM